MPPGDTTGYGIEAFHVALAFTAQNGGETKTKNVRLPEAVVGELKVPFTKPKPTSNAAGPGIEAENALSSVMVVGGVNVAALVSLTGLAHGGGAAVAL